jgi:excinuclease ABC subunit C
MSVLREMGMDSIPIIGLAERFEEVYVPFKSDPVVIPKDSNALHLLERIRDEAHRFAITYHRSLHGKNNLRSVLEDIPGIGPKRRIALFNRFGSIDAIKKASVEELCEVPGMNKTAAQSIKEYFEL